MSYIAKNDAVGWTNELHHSLATHGTGESVDLDAFVETSEAEAVASKGRDGRKLAKRGELAIFSRRRSDALFTDEDPENEENLPSRVFCRHLEA